MTTSDEDELLKISRVATCQQLLKGFAKNFANYLRRKL